MKRILSLIAATVFVFTLSGCKPNEELPSDSSNPSSVVDSTPSSTPDDTLSSVPDETSSSSTTSEPIMSVPDITSTPETNDEFGWLPDTRAGAYAKAALSHGEWGAMELVPEEAFEFVVPDFDAAWADEYVFANTLISANLFKVYVVKPAAGCEDQVKEWFDNYLTYCRESAAFYPQQQIQAEAAVVGVTEDGFCYLICNEEGAEIADYMTSNA